MNAPSDRWSARVNQGSSIVPGRQRLSADTGPESMTTGGVAVPPVPEGERRVSRRQLERLAATLSQRDRAVLQSVALYGFLTTAQIQTLHFTEHATQEAAARICRRVLGRLRQVRALEPLERRIGGLRAGSASYVYRLGPVGDRLLRLNEAGVPRARRKEPSLHFLDHRLAVADVACQLTSASRSGRFELLAVEPEPACWRRFSGGYGAPEILKPDLFAVTADRDYEDHWFVEVDRGTESLATVLDQCAQYERYRQSGTAQADTGLFPRVLWLLPDERRAGQVEQGISRRSDLDPQLFRTHTYNELLDVISKPEPKGGDDV